MSEEKGAAAPFSIGELVQHIAGGPLMAHIYYDEEFEKCTCTWIWRGKRHREVFQPCELKRPGPRDLDTKNAIVGQPPGSSLVAR